MKISLLNKHRITKAEKAILFLYSDLIGGHGLVITVECGDQHDQGAFREVEIGDETVDGFQLDAGIDEDAGVAAARYDLTEYHSLCIW